VGITGNQLGIPNGISKAQYQVDPKTGGLTLISTQNPNIKWEQTKQFNIGVDFSVFAGRLSGTIDYFHKKHYRFTFAVDPGSTCAHTICMAKLAC